MGYWTLSLALIAFGVAGAMSIGRPFLMIGLAMLLLGRVRRRTLVYWPFMLGLVAYNVAYWAIVPFYCSATSTVGGASTATCASLTGIPWPVDPSGLNVSPAAFDISNGIALVVGILTAIVALTWLWLERQRKAASHGRGAAAA